MEMASLRRQSFDFFFFLINLARKTLMLHRSVLFTTKVLCCSLAQVPVEVTSKLLGLKSQELKVCA